MSSRTIAITSRRRLVRRAPTWPAACIVLAALALGACSGGSDGGRGDDEPTPMTTITGIASDDPLSGATVEIRSTTGQSLGTAQTDSNGRYSISIPTSALQGGYQVVATGGQIAGATFTGTLRAVYAQSDAANAANATLLTSLIYNLAELEPAGDLTARRNVVLDRLSAAGLFARASWNAAEPANVNLPQIRAEIAEQGYSSALSNLSGLMTAAALSAPDMDLFVYFPAAMGGITGITYGQSTFGTTFRQVCGRSNQHGRAADHAHRACRVVLAI